MPAKRLQHVSTLDDTHPQGEPPAAFLTTDQNHMRTLCVSKYVVAQMLPDGV